MVFYHAGVISSFFRDNCHNPNYNVNSTQSNLNWSWVWHEYDFAHHHHHHPPWNLNQPERKVVEVWNFVCDPT